MHLETHIPYSQGETLALASSERYSPEQLRLINNFKIDLATERPPYEILALHDRYYEQVMEEQKRLQSLVTTDEQGNQCFDIHGVITGDLPYVTPYDEIKSEYTLLPPEVAAEAFTRRHYNLWILNHPSRIFALKKMITEEYTPPVQKNIPVIDEAIRKKIALDFDDLGLVVKEPDDEDLEDSARSLLAQGPYTWVASNLVALPYILSSMPDVSNSLSIATHALSGGVGFIPFDSIWNNFENKLTSAKRAKEIIENDPIIQNHPDSEFLLKHYNRLIGITIKPNEKSIEEVKAFIREGFTTFRIYDARSKKALEKTFESIAQALQDEEFTDVKEKVTFFVGQITGTKQAFHIQETARRYGIGISLVDGIGAGGICKTPKEAGLHTSNIIIGRTILKEGLQIPFTFDGGIGDKMAIVFAMGGAAGFKSQALVGGTIEQPPGMWYLKLPDGRFAKLYSGEAAGRTKHGGDKTDFLGRILFSEGADSSVILKPESLSMTDNTYSLLQSLTTAMIFARVDSIKGYHQMENPPIWTATDRALERASVHHKNGK